MTTETIQKMLFQAITTTDLKKWREQVLALGQVGLAQGMIPQDDLLEKIIENAENELYDELTERGYNAEIHELTFECEFIADVGFDDGEWSCSADSTDDICQISDCLEAGYLDYLEANNEETTTESGVA